MSKIDDLLREAEAEKGYIEKSRAAYDKYGTVCLYPKTDFAGCDNLTKFAVEAQHPNGQPWCQTFVAALLIRVFGRETADKLLCGKLRSASTMEVKDAMVKAGRSVPIAEAKPGDLAYRSRSGGGHVGIITGWRNGELVTVEGNTSGSDVNSWNGGTVAEHEGATWMWVVRPDYSIADWHWLEVGGVWYYQDATGRNSYGWKLIQETASEKQHWYFFNDIGQMQTGLQEINGVLFYLMEAGELEGALCRTDDSGALSPWYL